MNDKDKDLAGELSNTIEPVETPAEEKQASAIKKQNLEQGLLTTSIETPSKEGEEYPAHDAGSKAYQQKLLTQLENQYYIAGSAYFFKDQPKKLAFKETQNKIITGLNDERAVLGMVILAQARGWTTLKVSGHPDFCRQVWLEASSRQIQVQGYAPNEQDLGQLDKRLEYTLKNQVQSRASRSQEPATTASSSVPHQQEKNNVATQASAPQAHEGQLLEHQSAPYEFNSKNSQSYYAKLATHEGEKVIWGIDLHRAISESKVAIGDTIKLQALGKQPVTVTVRERDEQGNVTGERELITHRNTWEAEKSQQQKILNTVVAQIVKTTIPDVAMQERLKNTIQEKIQQQAEKGELPPLFYYDKNATSIKQNIEKKAEIQEKEL
jgi:hypothetical protein